MFTEQEARQKRAFDDCGRADVLVDVNPNQTVFTKDDLVRAVLKYREAGERRCIASACIAWVWEDQEVERYVLINPHGQNPEYKWTLLSPGRGYKAEDVPPPESACGWMLYMPYLQPNPEQLGWWARPNLKRRGRCGRVLLTTMLEAP